jgi:hypothetical protein
MQSYQLLKELVRIFTIWNWRVNLWGQTIVAAKCAERVGIVRRLYSNQNCSGQGA